MAEQIGRQTNGLTALNGRSPSQTIDEMLTGSDYESLQSVLYQLLKQAEADEDKAKVNVLAAAYQICLSCDQQYRDIAAYQRSYEDAVAREYALRQQLGALMKIVDGTDTAVTPPDNQRVEKLHENGTVQGSLWQRVQTMIDKTFFHSIHDEPQKTAVPHQLAPTRSLPFIKLTQPGTQTDDLVVSKSEKEDVPNCKDQPLLTVYCLGAFQAYEDEHLIDEWPSKKGKAIFKYLLMHQHQPVAKEVLMDMFWPDADVDAARNNLNVAVYGLRQALRNGYPEFSHVLFQDDHYRLNSEMTVWVDVDAFCQCLGRAQDLLKQGDEAAAVREYHAAEALYQGEFLAEDRYEEWVLPIRQSLQDKYQRLLSTLSDYHYEHGAFAVCIELCQKTLVIEPCQEKVHRRLMRTYCHLGQDYLALRQYHQCATLLQSELEIAPEIRTSQLYEAIRRRDPSIFAN